MFWNNNIEQLEDNMLKFDTSFGTTGTIYIRRIIIVMISDGHTGLGKHTIIGEFTMKKSLRNYNFLNLKVKCKSYKGITRKESDLTVTKLKKKNAAGIGGLSNEILFKSAPETLPNLILVVLLLLLKDAIFHKIGAEV